MIVKLGGKFGGLASDYGLCSLELEQVQVDTTKVYTAQLDISVVNNADVVKITQVTAKS